MKKTILGFLIAVSTVSSAIASEANNEAPGEPGTLSPISKQLKCMNKVSGLILKEISEATGNDYDLNSQIFAVLTNESSKLYKTISAACGK